MTVSTILQRSARFSRARKRAAQEATATEDNVSEMTASAAPPLPRRPSAFRTRTVSDTISSQSTAPPPSRKPYKVYDATFSQRVIDPLEPLLEMCARRGEDPANSVGSDGGSIIVGIEVDMSEAAALREDSLATFPSVVPARRVRRRVVEVRGAPMRRPDGTHLGGMLILRDVTDERDPSGQSSTVAIRERTTKRGVGEASGSYYKQILDQMPQVRSTVQRERDVDVPRRWSGRRRPRARTTTSTRRGTTTRVWSRSSRSVSGGRTRSTTRTCRTRSRRGRTV